MAKEVEGAEEVQGTEEESEHVSDEEIEEVSSRKVKTPEQAQEKSQDLLDIIADLRRDQARDRKDRDTVIGELRAQVEELQDYIEAIKKQFEKARRRPQQTMVPPPPPPETEADKPLEEGSRPAARQGSFLRNIW